MTHRFVHLEFEEDEWRMMKDEAGEENAPRTKVIDTKLRPLKFIMRTMEDRETQRVGLRTNQAAALQNML
jgi:hypothetical protein